MNGRTPTKAERIWLGKITELGCIVCWMQFNVYTPAGPHHMKGCRKTGCHFLTIPLCHQHHQGGTNDQGAVSRHVNGKAEFELRYGPEEYLLAKTKEKIGWSTSKS